MRETVLEMLGLAGTERPFAAAVGAGGKTTTLACLGRELARQGKKTIITTTTHMRPVEGGCYTASEEAILRALKKRNPLYTGLPCEQEQGKVGALPEEIFTWLREQADALLVEADGSRRLPFKVPADWEPVVPEGSTHLFVLMGMKSLGRPLGTVCHRWERAADFLGVGEEAILTEERAGELLGHFYLEPLKKRFPSARIYLICSQAREELLGQAEAVVRASGAGKGLALTLEKGELQCIGKFFRE